MDIMFSVVLDIFIYLFIFLAGGVTLFIVFFPEKFKELYDYILKI